MISTTENKPAGRKGLASRAARASSNSIPPEKVKSAPEQKGERQDDEAQAPVAQAPEQKAKDGPLGDAFSQPAGRLDTAALSNQGGQQEERHEQQQLEGDRGDGVYAPTGLQSDMMPSSLRVAEAQDTALIASLAGLNTRPLEALDGLHKIDAEMQEVPFIEMGTFLRNCFLTTAPSDVTPERVALWVSEHSEWARAKIGAELTYETKPKTLSQLGLKAETVDESVCEQ